MAKGLERSDWAARWNGTDGTLACGAYRARFTVARNGVVRIVWQSGPDPGPDYSRITQAAYQAADAAARG